MELVDGVSVPGVNQFGLEKQNQDVLFCLKNKYSSILACADGAGSTKFGAVGARHLVRNICKRLMVWETEITHDEFTQSIRQSIEFTRQGITRYCKLTGDGAHISDFASTLVLAMILKRSSLIAHLGDGCIFFLDADHKLVSSSLPNNGEYSNETFFFTDEGWQENLRIASVQERFSSCLVMSDGITPFALKQANIFEKFTTPILNYLKQTEREAAKRSLEETFLSPQSLQISKDDKSLGWYLNDAR